MSISEGEIVVGFDVAFGILLGVIVPMLFYFWRMHFLATHQKDTLESHIKHEEEILDKTAQETSKVKYAIRELSHYTKWLAEVQTGKNILLRTKNRSPASESPIFAESGRF